MLLAVEQGVAVVLDECGFAFRPGEPAAGVAAAVGGATGTGQQHAQTQQGHRADDDPEQEERSGGTGDVIAEDREVLR